MLIELLFIIFAYFLGSLPAAYLWVKWRYGADIRALGSGNAGARNAGRMYGTSTFIITLVGDASKAALAIFIASQLSDAATYTWMVGLAVIMGHVYPIFLGLQGGKGMACFAGGVLMLNWKLFIVMLVIAGILLLIVRKFTAAGLLALFVYPILVHINEQQDWGVTLLSLLTVIVVLYAHRHNMKKMIGSWNK